MSMMSCHSINPYFESQKSHHTPKGFKNPGSVDDYSFTDLLRWLKNRNRPSKKHTNQNIGFVKIQPESLRNLKKGTTQITWLGHSSVLLQLKGYNILFDPIFSNRTSPFSFIGPKRQVVLPIDLKDLPPIDYIVLSHDHYDHLDIHSIQRLAKLNKDMQILTPLAYKSWFKRQGLSQVFELDWWDRLDNDQLSFHLTPAQHGCQRGLFARNTRLWGSWVVKSDDFSFFFAGDSGFSEHFNAIAQHYGPFDVAALPIGTYEPRSRIKTQNMNPKEAVQAHIALNAKYSFSIHWGTFLLSDEGLEQPKFDLDAALLSLQPKNPFQTLAIGQSLQF